MSSRPRLPHETGPLKRFLQIIAGLLLCAGILAGFWALTRLGPQKVDYDSLEFSGEIDDTVRQLEEQSREYEARFEEILVLRTPTAEDIQLLQQAVDAQHSFIEQSPGIHKDARKRLSDLEARYQDFAAQAPLQQSQALEAQAERADAADDTEQAYTLYQRAHDIQKTINEDYPLSDAADAARAARLLRQAQFLIAKPLHLQSLQLEAEAERHIQAQEWAAAEAALIQAEALQDQLNREHRGTLQADVARQERLKVQIIGVASGQLHTEIQQMLALADQEWAAANYLMSAEYYQEAARLQTQLNREFPASPHASSDQVALFQRKSQTAQSFTLGREIEAKDDRLTQLLKDRKIRQATELIVTLRRDIQQLQDTFPRSSLNNEDLQVKIRYLNLIQSDLSFIQDRIYASLLPIPEEPNWQLYKTEIPQGLYAIIMGTNPSRNPGDANPVDSVSWIEAQKFCERIRWIIGRPVRLPTENEYRAALGRLRYVVLEDHTWSVAQTNGIARPVGTKAPMNNGFHDLLGNVSEWLQSIDRYETEDARHIGGHAQDSIEVIYTVPVRDTPRGERNRMTGFRIAVDLSN